MSGTVDNHGPTEISLVHRITRALARIRFPRVLLALLVIVVAAWDLKLLTQYPVAAGIDGYYYVLQINGILTQGSPYYQTNTPVVPYALAALTRLTGNPILMIKLASVVLQIFLTLGVFALVVTITRVEWLGLLGALIASMSGLRFYMQSEFLNNLAAIVFVLWAGWFLIKFLETQRLPWGISSLLLLAAGLFSHRTSVVLVTTMIFFLGLIYLLRRKALWKRIIAVLAIVPLWLLPAIVATQRMFALSSGVRDEISSVPRLPFDRYALAEELMVMIGSVLVLLLLFHFRNHLENDWGLYVFGLVALLSLVVTLNPFLNADRGWLSLAVRLRGLSYIQAAILIPALLWYASRVWRITAVYLLAAFLPLMLVSAFSPLPGGLRPEYLAERAQLVEQLPAAVAQLGPDPFVIAAHGNQFLVTAVIGVTAQQTGPVDRPYQNVYWLIRRWDNKYLSPADIVVRSDSSTTSTILAADGDLRTRIAGLDSAARRQIFNTNSHLARPTNQTTTPDSPY